MNKLRIRYLMAILGFLVIETIIFLAFNPNTNLVSFSLGSAANFLLTLAGILFLVEK